MTSLVGTTAGGITHGFLIDKAGNFTTIDFPGASATRLGYQSSGDIGVSTLLEA